MFFCYNNVTNFFKFSPFLNVFALFFFSLSNSNQVLLLFKSIFVQFRSLAQIRHLPCKKLFYSNILFLACLIYNNVTTILSEMSLHQYMFIF